MYYYKLYLKAIKDTVMKKFEDSHGFEITLAVILLTLIGIRMSYITGNPLLSIRTFLYSIVGLVMIAMIFAIE
jgi:hypothetical protein